MRYISVFLCVSSSQRFSPSAAFVHNVCSHYLGLNMVFGSAKYKKATSNGILFGKKNYLYYSTLIYETLEHSL